MSSFTEVETGTERLLFEAWQVRMECKSVRVSLRSRRLLTTSPLVTSSEMSSNRAWSLHQLTFGLGLPEGSQRKKNHNRCTLFVCCCGRLKKLESVLSCLWRLPYLQWKCISRPLHRQLCKDPTSIGLLDCARRRSWVSRVALHGTEWDEKNMDLFRKAKFRVVSKSVDNRNRTSIEREKGAIYFLCLGKYQLSIRFEVEWNKG